MGLFILLSISFAAAGILSAFLTVADAQDIHQNMVNELENSDFYPGDEYCDIICDCIKIIPESVVVHRLTGDGAKKDLIAPLWSADKKNVLNTLNKRINEIQEK